MWWCVVLLCMLLIGCGTHSTETVRVVYDDEETLRTVSGITVGPPGYSVPSTSASPCTVHVLDPLTAVDWKEYELRLLTYAHEVLHCFEPDLHERLKQIPYTGHAAGATDGQSRASTR